MKTYVTFISNAFSAVTYTDGESPQVVRNISLDVELEAFEQQQFTCTFQFGQHPYQFEMTREEVMSLAEAIKRAPGHYINKTCGVFKQVIPAWARSYVKARESISMLGRSPEWREIVSKSWWAQVVADLGGTVCGVKINPETLAVDAGDTTEPAQQARPAAAADEALAQTA